MGYDCHYIDSTKAKNKLGYRHSIEDLKKAVSEVLENGIESQVNIDERN